jgi:hypothetical protein
MVCLHTSLRVLDTYIGGGHPAHFLGGVKQHISARCTDIGGAALPSRADCVHPNWFARDAMRSLPTDKGMKCRCRIQASLDERERVA